ncbi:vacuolar protein sorting-associated protein 18 homolog [Lethenteron reissneri]|uniref:vacuolar protein sorting-associated protein 18 homolog n=1 Tax=Lethenteron reissneri TaxID=7753 RepID=UPI002AB63FE7|nr:vacuolar protein sorting-associated protein 18 homolog [Lethenteron reissneri]
MASLFDQYEDAQSRPGYQQQQRASEPFLQSGIVSARLEDETPIFSKKKINFTPTQPITYLVISNNQLCLAMGKNMLLRIDLDNPDKIDELEVLRAQDDKIHKLFLDPTGSHLLIALESQECLYLSRNSRKAKNLSKWRSHLIECVGWNKLAGNEVSTGPILVGTRTGTIWESEISSADQGLFGSNPDQYFKQLYTLGEVDSPSPVCCIEVERVVEGKCFIIATTNKRLYQFFAVMPEGGENPVYQSVFNNYMEEPPGFLEFPAEAGYSDLALYTQKLRSSPRAFAWMTGSGVYFGSLDYNRQGSMLADAQQWPYPTSNDGDTKQPNSIVLTQFHFLLMFPDRMSAICTLNGQLTYEDIAPVKFGRLLRMIKDPTKGTVWSYTENAVFRYYIARESRDVWQMYLGMGKFDLAKEYCKDRPECLDKVQTKQAEHYFKTGKYIESAMYYALTHSYFEEIALKFIEAKQEEALKVFLTKKLTNLKTEDKTQITMLVTWIIELYLNRLGQLKDDRDSSFPATQDEFHKFLMQSKLKECLQNNRTAIYELIASHGNVEDLVFFAVLIQDYERVLSHHIQHEDYTLALEVLARHGDRDLVYRFSPVLMQHVPRELVKTWIEMGRRLEPRRLIPALVSHHQAQGNEQVNQAICYLEFCVNQLHVEDQAIHNYLLSLYAQHAPHQLITYLESQGQNAQNVGYDLKYALRLCAEHNLHRACVHIYTTMELYEEAVDLALKEDVELAKLNADRPEDDEDLRKKLWLKIARHVVEEEKDVRKAMACLPNCDLLKIEDILPFFPDFVTIDHFKEAICSSLEEYNKHIEELKEEMEEATESARRIRQDIHEMRNKYGVVNAQEKCASCLFPLLNRGFYLFPCGHMFHGDCLVREVYPHLSSSKKATLDDIQRKLGETSRDAPGRSHKQKEAAAAAASASNAQQSRETLTQELDDIVAVECVYCGEIMLKSIDKPLTDESDAKEWL